MTNFQNGDYLTPTLLNTRVPSWASSGNTGAMNAIAVANLPAPVLNVIVDYGAKGDGANDDWSSIQSAVDAASVSGEGKQRHVFLPPGVYTISQPILITGNGVHIEGSGRGRGFTDTENSTQITHSFADGPIFALGSSSLTLPLVSSLINSNGSALDFTPLSPRWFNFRDIRSVELSGLGAFCAEVFYKPTSTAAFYTLMASSGALLSGDPSSVGFKLGITGTTQPYFTLKTTSGTVTATMPVSSITVGTTYHIAGTYDGANVRVYAAPIGTSSVPTAIAQTGTVVQGQFEDVTLAIQTGKAPEGTQAEYSVPGQLQCPRLSDVARYTGTITAPNAELVSDSNTLIVMPCVTQRGFLTKGSSKNGDAWLAYRQTGIPAGGQATAGVQFRNMIIYSGTGGAIGIYGARSSSQANIYEMLNIRGCRKAIYMVDALDGFWWTIRNSHINAGTASLFGLAWQGSSGIALLDSLVISGFPCAIFGNSGSAFNQVYCLTGGDSVLPVVLMPDGTTIHTATQIAVDTESGFSTGYRAALAVGGTTNATFSFVGFGCGSAGSAPSVILSGPGSGQFICPNFSVTTAPSIFSTLLAPAQPILLSKPIQLGSFVPWSDTTGSVAVDRLGTYFSASTGSTVQFDASRYDDWDITLSSNVTVSSWTRISYGQRLTGLVKIDSTGSRLFTWPTNSKGTVSLSTAANAINTFAGIYDGVNVVLHSVRTGL